MSPTVEEKLDAIREILRAHRVERAYLFGSAASGHLRKDSDVDILLSFQDIPFGEYATNYWALEEALQELLQREVDVVVERTLTNPILIKSIRKNRIPIYEG